MALFLVLGLVVGDLWFEHSRVNGKGILGGPSGTSREYENIDQPPAALYSASPVTVPGGGETETAAVVGGEDSVLAAALHGRSQPMGIFSSRGSRIAYKVKQGDTLSRIALDFGISVQTITAANPRVRANALQIGQELVILPVSGIIYEVRSGDTLESVADFFNVRPTQIQEQNALVNFAALEPGTELVVPGAKSRGVSYLERSTLPNLKDYFSQPTQGFNWGRLHHSNAVDIANVCGTAVIAAAEGLVVDLAEGGWNSGYGAFILVEHPNETKTLYAHLEKVSIKIGDYVKQGEILGTMGATGNVHGPTGCHLHFEVDGAQNPFAR